MSKSQSGAVRLPATPTGDTSYRKPANGKTSAAERYAAREAERLDALRAVGADV